MDILQDGRDYIIGYIYNFLEFFKLESDIFKIFKK
jgi:hypothetical protein